MSVRKGMLLGLVVGTIGVLLRPGALGVRLEEDLGLPWLFAVRGPAAAPPDVAIVSIDRSSAQQLGMDTQEWPPPRHIHAAVIRRLNRLDVSTIVMDIWFERERAPEDDADLALAMAERRNVVLVQRVDQGRVPGSNANTELLQSPIGQFQQSAIGLAPFPLPRTSLTSFFWPFFETSVGAVPTLPAAALQIHGLPVLDRLRTLLGSSEVDDLDALRQPVRSAADTQQVMRALRRALADPVAARRAREQLETAAAGLPARHAAVLRALFGLYAGPDTYYLNFYGSPGHIETIPFHELLQEPGTSRTLAGKVVFVGMSPSALVTSAELVDTYPTIYSTADGVELSGVEIGATAFANLLTDRTLKPVSPWVAIVGLFAFGGLAGFLARVLPRVPAAVAIAALAGAVLALAQFLFTAHARLVPVATPLLVQLPLALFVGLFLRYRDLRRQVPIEVDPDARQQLFNGVCLTTDVRGYTTLAEHLTPDELRALLDEYYAMLREIVDAHRGLVWGRGGDSALCVWKAGKSERAETRARLDACLAAIHLGDAIDRFNARHPAAERLPTCVGLDAGPLGLGPVGGELQAVGSPANAASRIQSVNRILGTRLLASRGVVQGLETLVIRRLGTFLLKGVSHAVEIVEIVSERGALTDRDRQLCERFEACLEQFEATDWAGAGESFQRLIDDYAADGPSLFYRDLCGRYRVAPPPGNDPVIRVDAA